MSCTRAAPPSTLTYYNQTPDPSIACPICLDTVITEAVLFSCHPNVPHCSDCVARWLVLQRDGPLRMARCPCCRNQVSLETFREGLGRWEGVGGYSSSDNDWDDFSNSDFEMEEYPNIVILQSAAGQAAVLQGFSDRVDRVDEDEDEDTTDVDALTDRDADGDSDNEDHGNDADDEAEGDDEEARLASYGTDDRTMRILIAEMQFFLHRARRQIDQLIGGLNLLIPDSESSDSESSDSEGSDSE